MMAVVQSRVLPQLMAVVQPSEQPQVTAVVSRPPATSPRSSLDVSTRRVSVQNVSFLPACFFMAEFYASRRLPFVNKRHSASDAYAGLWTNRRTARNRDGSEPAHVRDRGG